MSAQLAASQANETKWTVVNGAMQGSVRLMQLPSFVIGRSPECEFVIVNDPKCSRRHAQVEFTPSGCEISSLSENNLVQVNGREVSRAILEDGDIIRLGETEVQFNVTTVPPQIHTPQISIVPPGSYPMPDAQGGYPVPGAPAGYPFPPPGARRPPRPTKKSSTNPARLALYFIIGMMVLLMLTNTSSKKKKAIALRTEQQIQADIDAANKLQEAAAAMPNKRFNESVTAREAQENWVRGFRDYRKGQFERSLESFQACLALDPQHALCARYLRLAQRKFEDLVQNEIVQGRKYREQNLYRECRATFRNVIAMVRDANNPAYKEAKANYDACNEMVEGRY